MLSYIKWTFWGVFWALLLAFLHYTLPTWDVVRITDSYNRNEPIPVGSIFWANSKPGQVQGDTVTRDVFFIQAARPNAATIVYRNEDTGFGWPPYFKFNSSNVQAQAGDFVSSLGEPRWVAIKHYGWRWELNSLFPNAVRIKEVDGPDARVVPWVSISILVGIGLVFFGIWSRWRKFWAERERHLLDDPV
ncbi:MAG: DUF1523 family protein [Pseudomonadota bacterium]